MFNESDKVGIGVVIRNATGEIIATLSEKILKPASMAILKLLAARRAARFVQEIGLPNLILKVIRRQVLKPSR